METTTLPPLKTWPMRQLEAAQKHLASHKIPYTPSLHSPYEVVVTSPDRPICTVNILKDAQNCYQMTLDGQTDPMLVYPQTFLALFSGKKDWQAKTTKELVPFGPYKGQKIAQVWAQDPRWLVQTIKSSGLWTSTKMLLTVAVNYLAAQNPTLPAA